MLYQSLSHLLSWGSCNVSYALPSCFLSYPSIQPILYILIPWRSVPWFVFGIHASIENDHSLVFVFICSFTIVIIIRHLLIFHLFRWLDDRTDQLDAWQRWMIAQNKWVKTNQPDDWQVKVGTFILPPFRLIGPIRFFLFCSNNFWYSFWSKT